MTGLMERSGFELCVGEVEAIPLGEGRRFAAGDTAIAVFRTREGLYAVEDRCPHRGAPLSDGLTGAGQVICPYHAYLFNLSDGKCAQDAGCHLKTYPARVENGLIWIADFARSDKLPIWDGARER